MKSLALLEVGASSVVDDVTGPRWFRRRLLELGLVPGTSVERIGQAPLGDPLSFRVRGTTLSLRRKDAEWVRLR